MANLAGFDFVMEVAADALARMLRSLNRTKEDTFAPPFEFAAVIPMSRGFAGVQLIVRDLSVSGSRGSPWCEIAFQFDEGTVTWPTGGAVGPLMGRFVVAIAGRFVDDGKGNASFCFVPRYASAKMEFDPASRITLVTRLGLTDADRLTAGVAQSITAFVQGLRRPFGFSEFCARTMLVGGPAPPQPLTPDVRPKVVGSNESFSSTKEEYA